MNKQKQIEEMAKDIVRSAGLGVYEKAEYLYDLGYRKITENVVLTKEEYDELDKCRWNNKKVADILLRFETVEESIRKETAEKFAEMLKALFPIDEVMLHLLPHEQLHKAIDEICKEITEGKV